MIEGKHSFSDKLPNGKLQDKALNFTIMVSID